MVYITTMIKLDITINLPVTKNHIEKHTTAVTIIVDKKRQGSEHSTDFCKNVTCDASVKDVRIVSNSLLVICNNNTISLTCVIYKVIHLIATILGL